MLPSTMQGLTLAERKEAQLFLANQQRELYPLTPEQEEKTRLWLANLERERTDRSYLRKPEPKAEPLKVVVAPRNPAAARTEEEKKARRARDRAFYHAGRYAAGARDQEAYDGNRSIAGYINGKGNK